MTIFFAIFLAQSVVGFVPSTTRILAGRSRVPLHARLDDCDEKVQRTRQLADLDVDDSSSDVDLARQGYSLSLESWNVTQRAELKDYNRRIYETGRRVKVGSRDAGEQQGWRHAVHLLTALELDHAAAPPNVFTLNAMLVAALAGDQFTPSGRGVVAAKVSGAVASDGSDFTTALERVEWAWLRLVGEALPVIGREVDMPSVKSAPNTLTPSRGGWVLPDTVSLNTALKLWFADSTSQAKFQNGPAIIRASSAEAFARGLISQYGMRPDSTTVNSLIRIACQSKHTPNASTQRVTGAISTMAPHMARAEALAAVLESGRTIELLQSNPVQNPSVAGLAETSSSVSGSSSTCSSSATEVTFCSLLVGHASAGRLDLALDVFTRRLRAANISPSAVTISAMANALLDGLAPNAVAAARGPVVSDALALLDAAVDAAVTAQAQSSTSSTVSVMPFAFRPELLLYLGLGGEENGNLQSLWTDLSGVARLDRSFFNTVLKARRADGDLKGVLALLEAMAAESPPLSTQPQPKTTTITPAASDLKLAVTSGDYQRWRNAQARSKRGPNNGDKVSSNAARRAQWLAMTEAEQAAALAKIDAREAKMLPKQSEVPLSSLIFDSSSAGKKAIESATTTTAAAHGSGIDGVSLHIAVTACCDAQKPELALQLVAAYRTRVRITASSFNPILQAFAAGEPNDGKHDDIAIEDNESDAWPIPLTDHDGLQRAWKLYMHMCRGDWPLMARQKNGVSTSFVGEIAEVRERSLGESNTALQPVNPDAWTCVAMAEGHLRAKEPVNAHLAFHLVASNLAFPNNWLQTSSSSLSSSTRSKHHLRVEDNAAAIAALNAYLRALAASRAAAAANAASGKFSTPIQWQNPLRRGTSMSDKAIAAAERAVAESANRKACLAAAVDAVRTAVSWGSPDTQTMNGALAVCAACSSAAYTSDAVPNSYDNLDKGVVLVGDTRSSGSSNDWEINNSNEAFVGNAAAATALVLELLEDDCSVPRDMATVHLLIKGAANRGDLLTAFRHAARVTIDEKENGDVRPGIDVDDRRRNGNDLSDRTYSTLLGACLACNNLPEAIALLKHGNFFMMPSTGLSALDFSAEAEGKDMALSALLHPPPPFADADDSAPTAEAATNAAVDDSTLNLLPPRSRNSIYPPTLLRLLRALTAHEPNSNFGSGSKDVTTTKELVSKRLEEAVHVLVYQRPQVNVVDVTTNSAGIVMDTNQAATVSAAAAAAYVVVAEACVRGGKPQLLRMVMAAAAAEGVELQTRMSMSTDLSEG
jgi:pentatricopeptide repeat protein